MNTPSVHAQIIALPCDMSQPSVVADMGGVIARAGYRLGFADGKATAAELVLPLEKQRDELLEALKPFAAIAFDGLSGTYYEGKPDNADVMFHHASGRIVTVGDFKRAVAALAAALSPEGEKK